MQSPENHLAVASPVGDLTIWESGGHIVRVAWQSSQSTTTEIPVLKQASNQLAEYFSGDRRVFDLPMAPRGSIFQQEFYKALCAINHGETRTYGDLAGDLGVSAQAIGQACGANPKPILIPCHRVLGAANLGGFYGSGGIEAKVELLKLEGAGSLLI